MDQLEILFALKDIFSDTFRNQVVCNLLQFPIIQEYLGNSENLKSLFTHLGKESKNWTPANICKFAFETQADKFHTDQTNLFPDEKNKSLSTSINSSSFQEIKSLSELYPIAQDILNLRNKSSWQDIFGLIGVESNFNNDPKIIFETFLSIVYELSKEKVEFITGLLKYLCQDSGPRLLAQLLILNRSISEILATSSKTIFSTTSIDNFVIFIKEMQLHDKQEYIVELSRSYIEIKPLDENILNTKSGQTFPEELNKLQYLKNYASLFQIICDKKESERLTSIAKKVLFSIEMKFGLISNFGTSDNQIVESNNKEILSGNKISDHYTSELTQEILRIRNLAKTDSEAARINANEVYEKAIKEKEFVNSIFNIDLGFEITPDELIQVFIDLKLLFQAQNISKLLLKCWPQNIELIRKTANLSFDNGDHHTAINQFSILFMGDDLSREEKNKFALALGYANRWNDALKIRESINSINDKDILNKAICAFYGGNLKLFIGLISESKYEEHHTSAFKVLLEVLNKNEDTISSIEEKSLKKENFCKNDEICIILLADYLIDIGKNEKAIQVLENFGKNFLLSFSIVNRLHELYQKTGKSEKSHLILETDLRNEPSDQNSLETYISNLITSGYFDRAELFLEKYSNQWELSPRKILLSAKILLNNRKFIKAEKALHSLIDSNNFDVECLFDYCLAALECSLSDFPIGINVHNSNKVNQVNKRIGLQNKNKGILFEILAAALSPNNQLAEYQKLLQKYLESQNPEVWRIFAGLGKVYFDQQQYDSAIINFKKAFGSIPKNESLLWLLIQSYANLRLWNEIENIINANQLFEKKTFSYEFVNSMDSLDSSEWIHFLEMQVQKHPDSTIYKIILSQALLRNEKKLETVKLIRSFYKDLNVEDDHYLYCVQILIDAGDPLLAERLIEIFLSNKKVLDQNDYFASSFLFEQLGKSKKSLGILNHLEFCDSALLSYKAKLLSDTGNCNQSKLLISKAVDNIEIEEMNLQISYVHIPEIIQSIRKNPAQVYLIASSMEFVNRNIDNAIIVLEKGISKYPENQDILFSLIELKNFLGKKDEIKTIISYYCQNLEENRLPKLSCLLGEIALSQNEEIAGAKYLSEVLEHNSNNPKVKALQARLQVINGNISEAQEIYSEINEDIHNATMKSISQSKTQSFLSSKVWLAQLALDLKDCRTALRIIREEIASFGIFPLHAFVFINAFASLLEERFILGELKAKNQNFQIEPEDQETFSAILENRKIAHSEIQEIDNMITRCQIYLENDEHTFAKGADLLPEVKNINSIIYSIYRTKGEEAAEIAINSFKIEPNHEMFLAILEKDDNPRKALFHIDNSHNKLTPDVRTHALLAIVEKNLGNFHDSYAAISLAINKWPDEYEWQVMAGDLSKANGDLHSASMHYEKAQTINIKSGSDKNINEIHLLIENESAIPILEAQLAQNPNKDQIIQLGKIYLQVGNFRKAVKSFENAAKNYPKDANPYYWLSEIAFKLGNLDNALLNIEKAISMDGTNIQFINLNANIIRILNGNAMAIKYLDEKLLRINDRNSELCILKAKLIAEDNGNNAAVQFIDSIENLQENGALLIEKAKLVLHNGDLNGAEDIVENLLSQKDYKSDALAVFGSIAKERGELDRAIDFYIKSIEANPNSTEQYFLLAEIYNRKKDFKRSINTLEDGIKVNPGNFGLIYKAGLYYYQQGLYSEAGKRIKEAIKIEPSHQGARDILRLLENVMVIKKGSIIAV